MSLLAARPALGWIVVAVLIALALVGVAPVSGLGIGYLVAACLYPSRPDAPLVY